MWTRLPKSGLGPGSAVLARDGAEAEEAGGNPSHHLQGGGAGALLTTCPARPPEGAAARAWGPTISRPMGWRASTCSPLDSEPPKPFFLVAGAPLAPHLSSGPAFPTTLCHLLCSATPPLAFEVSPVPTWVVCLVTSC